jgi:hypothetical protein
MVEMDEMSTRDDLTPGQIAELAAKKCSVQGF